MGGHGVDGDGHVDDLRNVEQILYLRQLSKVAKNETYEGERGGTERAADLKRRKEVVGDLCSVMIECEPDHFHVSLLV